MTERPEELRAGELPGLIEALPPRARALLMGEAVLRHYAARAVIFTQDEPCSGLFLVESGLVKISKISVDGREQVLRHVSAGGSFNEVAVLDGGRNPATATIVESGSLHVVTPTAIHRMLVDTPELAEAILRVFAGRMRHLVQLVDDLSFRRVAGRLALILLQATGSHSGVGAGIDLNRRINQRELAEMAGTSREVVARALKTLEESGAIRLNRGRIELVAPERLIHLT
ncbi:MAG: Crp/Fnr family transcriptional regulator [Polyangiaceae bacterium]|nr:Crp/Fnr family transcriptional regulator [Polyangiaceae bacterium]